MTVSLEEKLTAKWEADRAGAVELIAQADYNLGRIAMIYGGQLYFDFENGEQTYEPPLQDEMGEPA